MENFFEYFEFFASNFSTIYPIEDLKENESIENANVMSEFCLAVCVLLN